MSRALDAETAASLRMGDPLEAYDTISSALVPPIDGLLDIEVLGKSHFLEGNQHVLVDGRALGISKLSLVQAFMVARGKLKGHLDGTSLQTPDELFAATAVILMFDPEHLTAANTRKRLLREDVSKGGVPRSALETEKRFVDSLLTSRLHRHTKSPTLWSHRRWLLGSFLSLQVPVDVLSDLREVVFVAGERHPRNYYAWCHARFLMGLKGSIPFSETLAAVRDWCFQHHTDISGWSFLLHLLEIRNNLTGETGHSIFAEVLDLVISLRLVNESVWVFLRTLAASHLVDDEQYARFQAVQAAAVEASKESADGTVLRAALDWSDTYRRHNGIRVAGA
ncbi:hypothetical protein MYCTH_2121685 [Thermothelomyces thermophilus ATCC 42464]|uniref:Protein prenyltransferase n=1 Tax=Thermothelomyces thermophilus (strain ATCC 42464 / BCRC 31852 / DSM 1799) TaxID=573729 RepID=G2QN48_THET4|nr:uncharacterized protein MYCTH_2121685 [Thermothelomyces thermophilus ATCC 42464]AEO61921.1 hypothetical protein MYCTH_2121685 [Thermothelomyces thermophilus ATCC 42464]